MFRLKVVSFLLVIATMVLVACGPAVTPSSPEEFAPTAAPAPTQAPIQTEPPLPSASAESIPLPSDTPESSSAPTIAPATEAPSSQTNASVVNLTTDNFNQEVLQSSEPVLILFWANWSGPSRAIKPAVEEIANDYAGRAKVGELNTDDYPDLSNQYSIQQLPTLILINNGNEQARIEGTTSKEEIAQMLDQPQGTNQIASPSSDATIAEITTSNLGEEVDQSSLPVLLAFWAPWNGASVAVKPALEEIASAYAGRVKVGTVNIDDYQDIGNSYAVQSLPTFILINQGTEQARLEGTQSKDEITAMLDQYLP